MPYANIEGVRIYYEVDGEGPPLVLAHGLSSELNTWRVRGYADALRNDFKLVMFDARGHGRSDKPHEAAAYGIKMVDDVPAVLDDAGISEAHYFGYSMGSMIGFRVATRYPERFRSFVFGGASPYLGGGVSARPTGGAGDTGRMLRTDPEALVQQREQSLGRPLTREERSSLLANDPEALIALTKSVPWDILPLTNDELSRISVPCLLYCGDDDPFHSGAKESVSHMPQAKFISLPGLNHMQVSARSDLVLPHVKKFLAEVAKP